MVRKSRKKNTQIQYGKGYPDELKRFITASAIEIGSDTDFVQFSPDCNLLNDEHCFNFNNIIIENISLLLYFTYHY